MNDIEQQFFKVFGIEPKNKCGKNLIYPNCLNPDKCGYDNCIYCQIEYPDITAEILLKLIVIVTSQVNEICEMIDVEDLKNSTLEELIEISDRGNIKQQVRSLFEVENE